jgi:hypothetical protein
MSMDTIAVLVLHIVPGAICAWRAQLSYPFLTVSDMLARKRTDIVLLPALIACAAWYTGSVHQRAYVVGAMYPLFRMRGPIELHRIAHGTVPLALAAAHAAWALAGVASIASFAPEAYIVGAVFVVAYVAGHALRAARLIACSCVCEWTLFYGLPLVYAERSWLVSNPAALGPLGGALYKPPFAPPK